MTRPVPNALSRAVFSVTEELGLSAIETLGEAEKTIDIDGALDGQRVAASVRIGWLKQHDRRGDYEDPLRERGLVLRLPFEPPFDYGLTLDRRADDDGTCSSTVDADRAAPIEAAVRAAFAGEELQFSVRDEYVEIAARRGAAAMSDDERSDAFRALFDKGRAIHARIGAARSRLPIAAGLQGAGRAFTAFAGAHGLAVAPAPLTLGGRADGVVLRGLGRANVPDGPWVDLEAACEEPCVIGLRLVREGLRDRLAHLFGHHDVEFGDPPFDRAFHVVAGDVETARAILDADARAHLLSLVGVEELEVDERRVRVRLVGDVAQTRVARALEASFAIARAFAAASAGERG